MRSLAYWILSFTLVSVSVQGGWFDEDDSPAEVTPSSTARLTTKDATADVDLSVSDYEIRPLDVLVIRVYQEEDLSNTNKVSQTGQITLPLVGTLRVAGLKLSEAEKLLIRNYKDGYLRNPQISLLVAEYASRKISVLGEVKNPGFVDFPAEKGLTLLQAIAESGGFQNVAKTDDVIIRRMIKGKETKIRINATDLMKADSKKEDYILQPDDVVYVPTRFF